MLRRKKRQQEKTEQKRIALERINILFLQAKKRPSFAKRYVRIARAIATRCTVRIPEKWRKRFCKKCNAFLTPGVNSSVRMRNKKLTITCKECGNVKRIQTT